MPPPDGSLLGVAAALGMNTTLRPEPKLPAPNRLRLAPLPSVSPRSTSRAAVSQTLTTKRALRVASVLSIQDTVQSERGLVWTVEVPYRVSTLMLGPTANSLAAAMAESPRAML